MHRQMPCLLPLLLLAACTTRQTYAGPQQPTAGTCDPPGRATLTRRGAAILLAPAEGTITLPGTLQGTSLAAQATLPGPDRTPYPLSFTGQLAGSTVSGTLVTPRCRYTLTLRLTDN